MKFCEFQIILRSSYVPFDLSNLIGTSGSVAGTPVSKLATYAGDASNAATTLPAPNSASWTTPTNNFEDDISAADQCNLSGGLITCYVPAGETIPKYTWIMISGINITNDLLTGSGDKDSATIVDVNIGGTVGDSGAMRVAIVRTGESLETDGKAGGSAALGVEILSSISITVEQPANITISPAAGNSDQEYSTGTVTVTTNVLGGYSVSITNDGAGNTLRNITDESIQITELPLSGVTGSIALQDNGFGICSNDTEGAACNPGTDTFYGVGDSWHELYSDEISDTTAEITYLVDVPGTQQAGTYQGVVTYLAAINL